MKLFLFYLTFFTILISYGQNHQLIDTSDYEKRKKLISEFEKKNENFNRDIKAAYKGKLRKEVLGFYEAYQAQFEEIIENKKILFQDSFQSHIDSLFTSLSESNSSLKEKNIKLFLSKNPGPNAFSIGNGTIIVNIGLFSFLENEHQLLSVLSHEAAHEILQHSHKTIVRKSNLNISVLSNGSNFSRTLRSEKYNKGSRSFEMLKDLLYEDSEKRRFNETQADSLGYILYKNTSASKMEFINALATMKHYDSVPGIVLDSMIYSKVFDLQDQPFNPEWTAGEDFKHYNYNFYKDKIDSDSLKDHPEMEHRIAKLKSTFPALNNDLTENVQASETFKKLKNIAVQAHVENLHYINEYGLSIYLILKRLEDYANDAYYQKWLGINFDALYQAKKAYQLNRYVDRLAPKDQSESYQRFLNFIWNLSLTEMRAIADHYNKV